MNRVSTGKSCAMPGTHARQKALSMGRIKHRNTHQASPEHGTCGLRLRKAYTCSLVAFSDFSKSYFTFKLCPCLILKIISQIRNEYEYHQEVIPH